MDQVKIGKFIVEQRKNKKLTQEQLAEKLNVSKNAVSKWERGLNLPDVSLMKDLCSILDISLNELFAGEKIKKEEYSKKADESIVNAINYTNNKAKKKINKVMLCVISVILIFVLIISMIIIDFTRMTQNKTVIFSTWGLKYYPAINLNEEKIEIAIEDYIVHVGDNEHKRHENQKTFTSMKVYLIEDKKEKTNVYAWVLTEKHYLENGKIIEASGYSIPHKFVLKKVDGEYKVVDSRIPRDGGYYVDDMKNIFPLSVRKEMNNIHYDGTIEQLELDIQKQIKLYFHQ